MERAVKWGLGLALVVLWGCGGEPTALPPWRLQPAYNLSTVDGQVTGDYYGVGLQRVTFTPEAQHDTTGQYQLECHYKREGSYHDDVRSAWGTYVIDGLYVRVYPAANSPVDSMCAIHYGSMQDYGNRLETDEPAGLFVWKADAYPQW